jgi:hypothetical protein
MSILAANLPLTLTDDLPLTLTDHIDICTHDISAAEDTSVKQQLGVVFGPSTGSTGR